MDRGEIINHGQQLFEEGAFVVGSKPFQLEGVQFFPAFQVRCATAYLGRTESAVVQLDMVTRSMLGNELGVFLRMTPEGARAVAAQLLATAQKVDDHVARQAAEAIEAARGKGPAQ